MECSKAADQTSTVQRRETENERVSRNLNLRIRVQRRSRQLSSSRSTAYSSVEVGGRGLDLSLLLDGVLRGLGDFSLQSVAGSTALRFVLLALDDAVLRIHSSVSKVPSHRKQC